MDDLIETKSKKWFLHDFELYRKPIDRPQWVSGYNNETSLREQCKTKPQLLL